MDKPVVAAVIQARMGSSRLPGKVLHPVAGKPVLSHIIERLRRSETVDIIAIATSDQACDDPLADFARRMDVALVRGPEDNVLQRFALAADKLDPDVIVRVTGDAPLIDPKTLDRLVTTLLHEKAEYCTGEEEVHAIHEGFAPFTRAALNRLLNEAPDDPVAVEHVTAYFVAHPDKFRIARIAIPEEHRFKGARISVDTPADVRFIEELYRRLGVAAGQADIAEVVKMLKTHPELLEINGHIYQKKATDNTFKVLIRCDGDNRVGMGHVVRCLALADEFRNTCGYGVTFAVASGAPAIAKIEAAGFPIATKPSAQDEAVWLGDLLASQRAHILLLDVRTDLSPDHVRRWRRQGILVAVVDDPHERRCAADLAFYPPVPQVEELDWQSFSGHLHVGWEWVLLRPQFHTLRKGMCRTIKQPDQPVRVLVSMGGSDPRGMTLKALQSLQRVPGDFGIDVVLGAGFEGESAVLDEIARSQRDIAVHRDVQDMAALMANASLAVASFGMTAYELAALGVPALYLCLTPDHLRSAELFVSQNMARSVPEYAGDWQPPLVENVRQMLEDPSRLAEMRTASLAKVDGLGVPRTVQAIAEKAQAQRTIGGI
jgi:spore coat polysaccharide biosynthesis protein SpsF